MNVYHIKSREEWLHPEAYAPVDYDREQDRIQQLVRLNRKEMWQYRVTVGCLLVAGLIACGIIAQFARGWF